MKSLKRRTASVKEENIKGLLAPSPKSLFVYNTIAIIFSVVMIVMVLWLLY